MPRAFAVPDMWAHLDWETCCEACRQPLFMVAVAERQVPAGPFEVTRCAGCARALWYRSTASPHHVRAYHQRVIETVAGHALGQPARVLVESSVEPAKARHGGARPKDGANTALRLARAARRAGQTE